MEGGLYIYDKISNKIVPSQLLRYVVVPHNVLKHYIGEKQFTQTISFINNIIIIIEIYIGSHLYKIPN